MYSFVCLLVVGLFISNVYGRAIEEPDNSIQSDDNQYTGGRDWVKISDAPPPKIVQQIGSPVELECEVSGSPPPTVHWVRGNKPLDSVSIYIAIETRLIIRLRVLKFLKLIFIISMIFPTDRRT